MLERDYIMRLIREFMAALGKFLEKPEADRDHDEIKDLYRQYAGDYTFYHTATIPEVMESMEQFAPSQRVPRLEILAELYYAEADMLTGPAREMLLDKSLTLFRFVSEHDKTYSFDRIVKMERIRKSLDNSHADDTTEASV
ncbi:MAG: hypothetical protein MR450_00380 [Prevotella sp.]|nr:hypothetical protein [Prevotella sp.]MDY4038398.1 hypothetical protein [Prevotella sp.]